MEKKVLHQWLKAGYLEAQELFPTESGTPQGGIISPVLANMTLDGLEEALVANWPSTKKGKAQVYLTRYADDFVITANQREILKKDIKPKVKAFPTERGLSLSPEKTVITHIDEGFDFLGQNIRKYDL